MKFHKGLLALAVGGFGIGLTEFVMMGILPEVAADMGITIPQAGHFISAYALGVVIGAPLLVMIAGSFPPKKLLIALMICFTVFNSLTIMAPNYNFMMASRLLSGLPHGAFFGVGAVVASRLARENKAASAVAVMFSGLTFANIFGIPVGTYLGQNISWRYTFALVALVGVLAIISLIFLMPALPKKNGDSSIMKELNVFTRLEPWLILAVTAIGTGGFFAWYSYIAPLLTEVSGFSKNNILFILMFAGVGMTVGNLAGGKLADAVSPSKATAILLTLMAVSLLTISFVAESQWAILTMTFITGGLAFSISAPIQMLMIKAASGSEMLASSVNQAGFNIGNAIGAFLGGIPIAAGYGFTSPQLVGASLALGGALVTLLVISYQRKLRRRPLAVLNS